MLVAERIEFYIINKIICDLFVVLDACLFSLLILFVVVSDLKNKMFICFCYLQYLLFSFLVL